MRFHLNTLCSFILLGTANAKKRGNKLLPVIQEERALFGTYINPCTGSFSNDAYDPNMKCPTDTPTKSPSKSPTRAPTAKLSSSPSSSTDDSIVYECPGNICNFESGENVLTVSYLYTVETSQAEVEPIKLSDSVEAGLVEIVAEGLLGHCITPDEGVRMLLQTSDRLSHTSRRRFLTYKRKLNPTGVCSLPNDYYIPTKECLPIQDVNNECYVFQGYVSIFLEADDNIDAISNQVHVIVKNAMDQDALVAEDSGIQKVTYIAEENNTGDIGGIGGEPGAVIGSNVDENKTGLRAGIIIGSCIAALLLLFGLIIIRRKGEEYDEVDEGPFGLVVFPGLFEGPDENNLSKRCTCQDVKICSSQTCRCFEEKENPVSFVNSSKDPKAIQRATKAITPFSMFENPLRFLFGSKSEDSSIQQSKSDVTDEFY